MKIWTFSDTHTYHNQLNIPEADIVIFSGDESNNSNPYLNEVEARKFFEWYKVLPFKHKIYIPGNHSTAVSNKLIRREEYPELIWLEHETANVEGIKIFGSPYTPAYGKSWAYMRKRNQMKVVWDTLPNDIQILITHGPPKGILDLTRDLDNNLVQAGCKSLFNKVLEIEPAVHIFGHLHDESGIFNSGILEKFGIKFINASCLNHKEKSFSQGHIIEI